MVATLSGAFGALATLLAVVGLYGVMSFSVARRSREIAIRMAFGAPSWGVVGMVMREVGLLIGIGVAVALPAYVGVSRLIGSQLYGITTSDAASVAGAVVLLSAVALLAGFLPARRAAQVDPIEALRYE